MGRVMRYAIESMADESKGVIEIKGPLATVFSDALAVALAKRNPGDAKAEGQDPSISLESQQQEVALMGALLQKIQHGGEEKKSDDPAVLYAVSGPEVTEKDYVEITSEIVDSPNPQGVVVLVDKGDVDASGTPEVTQDVMMNNGKLLSALESAVVKLGGRYYTSMESLIKDCL